MSRSFLADLDRLCSLKAKRGTGFVSNSTYRFFPCETEETIAVVEQSTGFPVPPDLKHLLLTLGGFLSSINGELFLTLAFHSYYNCPKPFGGLSDILQSKWYWEDYRDPDTYTETAVKKLNENFVCFGYCDIDESSADHFFYDRNGHFGVLHFNQDFIDEDALHYLHELLGGINMRPPLTLEQLLVRYNDCY